MKSNFSIKHFLGISVLSVLFSSSFAMENENPLADMSNPGIVALYEASYDDAKNVFLAQLKDPKLKNEALTYLSKIAMAQGDAEAAIEYAEKALALEPTDADELVLSGDTYCNLAQQSSMFAALKLAKKCIAQYEAAITLDGNHVNALASAVKFHLSAPGIAGGSRNKGEAFFVRLNAISPEDANTLKVAVLNEKDDTETALQLADQLKEAKFASAKNQYEIARFYRDKKRYSDARSLFETMREQPISIESKWYIDDSLLQLGELFLLENTDIPKSIALLEEYKQKNRNPFDVHYYWSTWSLAKAYKAAGDLKKYEDLVANIKSENYKSDKPFAKEFEESIKRRN